MLNMSVNMSIYIWKEGLSKLFKLHGNVYKSLLGYARFLNDIFSF